ncbi:MAG: bestrophin family ion channel [Crocinitomicaceae bacterium]|nr:bestrophin family ion channel [Crocinitomicaceae bacterium]
MIKYNPKSWFQLIFAFHKSDTFRILWKELIYIGLFTILIAYLEIELFPGATFLSELVAVYSLIGFVISLLLVFRTNTAYDRWWEGRKRWGSMVNDTRNLAIKINMLGLPDEDRDFFQRMIPNFTYAAKEHLRRDVKLEELELTETEVQELVGKEHPTLHISNLMYKRLKSLKTQGKLTEEEFLLIDKNLNALLDSLGACERILNTPIPFSYSLFLKKFIFIYVTTMPLAFVTTFGYFSALIATFVFYVLVSMEVLAEEIEDPFGTDDNDLPIDGLCLTIKKNVNQIFDSGHNVLR